jgi:alkylation response protein AidB-like acyl-CoA dehydrogenase
MQALGANGLKDEFGLGRQLAAARVAEFMDGTSEIQNIVIGRALAKWLVSS